MDNLMKLLKNFTHKRVFILVHVSALYHAKKLKNLEPCLFSQSQQISRRMAKPHSKTGAQVESPEITNLMPPKCF